MHIRPNSIACLCMAVALSWLRGGYAGESASSAPTTADSTGSRESAIDVQSVVLRLLEEAEVPAQEAGVITGVAVREGQRVPQHAGRSVRSLT